MEETIASRIEDVLCWKRFTVWIGDLATTRTFGIPCCTTYAVGQRERRPTTRALRLSRGWGNPRNHRLTHTALSPLDPSSSGE